ncbi:MAG: S9 family peptidase [Bacteroidetes bacterium]|nr:S9 family peptidase [Bacteroidota bacterium]
MRKTIIFLIAVINFGVLISQQTGKYMFPPQEIIDLVDAPVTPTMRISPDGKKILFLENPGLTSLEDLAEEELRLAGIRINPKTNGPSRSRYSTGLSFADIDGTNLLMVNGLPLSPKITNVQWSPDASKIAFTNTIADGIELWVADIKTANAKKLTSAVVNDVMGNAYEWLYDNKNIIFLSKIETRGIAPKRPLVADAPVVQENIGRRAAVRTYQDLIRDVYDERIFDYYASSQLCKVDLNGKIVKIGKPGIIWYFNTSPDGKYLLVNYIMKPYSYIVPFSRFPQRFEILDVNGKSLKVIAEIPLSDNIPQGFDAVRKGPRSFTWRSDKPATLYWVEALDEGDPSIEAEYRDQVFFVEAPFVSEPKKSLSLKLRFSGFLWGRAIFAIINESWRKDRRMLVSYFNPNDESFTKSTIFDYSTEDRYNHPGSIQTIINKYGQRVVQFDNTSRRLYLAGQGASPEGNMPFIDRYDLRTGKIERLWQSEAPYYEYSVNLLDADKGLVITRRESQEEHPNFYLRNIYDGTIKRISDYPEPFSRLRQIEKQLIQYQREDGVSLSGTLYLPEGFVVGKDNPLPTILWAYPREFISSDAAGQVSGSPYTYNRVGASSIVMLVTQGYAILDNASFPIVGETESEPNDTFIEQLVANAKAAIDKLVEMGVTDSKKVGVSGHSYGAFMTANLLSHSDLFAAGVARSGAYNRTLTPFGFQSEERTFWQAPELYHRMSPFSSADKMKTPLLLIHGAEDNNSGTFPVQSERYYDALRGLGATVRLVMLPHESHGYVARESILHMHWETLHWFDKYLKEKE